MTAAVDFDLICFAAALILCSLSVVRELGARQSLVAGITAAALSCVALLERVTPGLAAICVIFWTSALIVEVDRRFHIIPNVLVAAIFLVAVANPFEEPPMGQVLGCLLVGGLFLGVRLGFALRRKPDALGLGDVKLAAAMGALLGASDALLAVAIAGVATSATVLVRGRTSGAPFGVGLAAALFLLSLTQAAA